MVNRLLLIGALVVVLAGGVAGWFAYNASRQLAMLYEEQEDAWSDLERRLQKRTDSLLAIRDVIKVEVPFETGILKELSYAQIMMEGASDRSEKIEAYNESELVRVSLPLVAFNFDRVGQNAMFSTHMDVLENLHHEIEERRRQYNRAVREYNRMLLTFPGNLVALMVGYQEKPLFQLRGEGNVTRSESRDRQSDTKMRLEPAGDDAYKAIR